MKGQQILIDNEVIRARFNELLRQSREQRQKMNEHNTQLTKLQNEGLQKYGLTKQDVDIATSGPAQ